MAVREKMIENVPKKNKCCDKFCTAGRSVCRALPHYKFCEKLAEVLKVKFPATFRLENTVQSLGQ